MTMTQNNVGSSPKRTGKKMVMQVNKYIPHYMRIPAKLQKNDIKAFQNDYYNGEPIVDEATEVNTMLLNDKNRRRQKL